MEALRGWLRSVVVVIIIGGFLELLLPSDDSRRFVRMVINLLLVLALVGPLVQLVRKTPGEIRLPAVVVPEGPSTAELVTAGENLKKKSRALFLAEGRERLIGRVREIVQMLPDVQTANADVILDSEGMISRVDIVIGCAAEKREAASSAARRIVSALLEIPPESIRILGDSKGGWRNAGE